MQQDPQVSIQVRLIPRAGQNRVVGWESDLRERLVVRVQAPPVDGSANAALIAVLAGSLGIAKSRVRLLRGQKSRSKLIGLGIGVEAFEHWASSIPVIGKE